MNHANESQFCRVERALMSPNGVVVIVRRILQNFTAQAGQLERLSSGVTRKRISRARILGWLTNGVIVGGLICGFAAPIRAQLRAGITAPLEVGGGYAYTRGNPDSGGSGFNLNGGTASLTYRFHDYIALVGDFGVYHFNDSGPGITSTMYTYLFGPRLILRPSGRERRFAPFTQVLVGGGRLNASTSGVSAGENGFALAAGGGLDLNTGGHFAFRIVEAEYLMTRFAHPDGSSATQNNVRISSGIVFRFGSR